MAAGTSPIPREHDRARAVTYIVHLSAQPPAHMPNPNLCRSPDKNFATYPDTVSNNPSPRSIRRAKRNRFGPLLPRRRSLKADSRHPETSTKRDRMRKIRCPTKKPISGTEEPANKVQVDGEIPQSVSSLPRHTLKTMGPRGLSCDGSGDWRSDNLWLPCAAHMCWVRDPLGNTRSFLRYFVRRV